MLVLGIETSTTVCAVSLIRDGQLLAEYRHQQEKKHAEIIATLIGNQIAVCDLAFADLEGIGIATGPGSYTGLRIGMSFAKSLAFAHDLPLAGIPTTAAIAFGLPVDFEQVIVALPSRRGEIYAALFTQKGDRLQADKPATALEIAALPEWAGECRKIAGPGGAALAQTGLQGFELVPERFWQIGALNIALLAEEKLQAGQADDLDSLEPDYLKPFYTTAGKQQR